MKSLLFLFLLLGSLCFTSCEKEQAHAPELPLEEALPARWVVVHHTLKQSHFSFKDDHQGIVTQWGDHYIHSLTLHPDGTYYINDSDIAPADHKEPLRGDGTWTLRDNLLFFLSTTNTRIAFNAWLSSDGMLLLENSQLMLKHQKRPLPNK